MPFKRYKIKSPYEIFKEQWEESNVLDKYNATFLYPEIYRRIKKYSDKDSLILEAGCGLGGWIIRLNKSGYNVIGLDIIPEAILAIKRFNQKLNVKISDVKKIDLVDNSVDLYLSFGVIEHDENGPCEILNEAFRVIKKNKFGIISVPNHYSIDLIRSENSEHSNEFYQYEFSKKEFINILKKNNFKIIEIFPYGIFVHLSKYKYFKSKKGNAYSLNLFGKLLSFVLKIYKPYYYSRMICAVVMPNK